MTDEDLVARAQAGREDAWAELVHRHHAAVFRAAQEAWIAAWNALDGFRGQSAFRTWLLTIAWRKSLDRRRSVAGWLRMVRIDRVDEDDEGPSLQLASEKPSAEEDVVDRVAHMRLKKLVRGLPRAHRDALLLVATQDLPYADAAALLGVPVGTLKWRVSDARRILRERMQR